jgi:hypothetical protein
MLSQQSPAISSMSYPQLAILPFSSPHLISEMYLTRMRVDIIIERVEARIAELLV